MYIFMHKYKIKLMNYYLRMFYVVIKYTSIKQFIYLNLFI